MSLTRDPMEDEERIFPEEFDAWREEVGLFDVPEGDAFEEFLRCQWEKAHPLPPAPQDTEDDIAF